jgi:hypothetical protein
LLGTVRFGPVSSWRNVGWRTYCSEVRASIVQQNKNGTSPKRSAYTPALFAVVAKMIYRGCVKVFSAVTFAAVVIGSATAHDDGRYAGSPLKPWFDSLKSGKGLCCSFADGFAIADPDWESKDGHYRVRLEGQWIAVPEDAVITEPNRAGRTMVWPIKNSLGTSIRCFMPGSMS